MTHRATLLLAPALAIGCSLNDGVTVDSSDTTDLSGMLCDDALVEAAFDTATKFPNFRVAKDTDLADGNQWREAHAEKDIDGFGVTLVRGTAAVGAFDAIPWSGDMNEPSLLFFEKNGSNKSNWQLIGFGYATEWHDSDMGRCIRPEPDCLEPEEFQKAFIVHEAGYHGLYGGWKLAQTSNLKSGRGTVDSAGCNLIDHDDLKTKVGWGKHGRVWTSHIYLDPDDGLPMMSTFDPWRRDGDDGYQAGAMESGSFFEQGDCSCSLDLPKPEPVSVEVVSFWPPVIRNEITDDALDELTTSILADYMYGARFTPVTDGGTAAFKVTELIWTSRIESFLVRTNDTVLGVTYSGSFHPFTSASAFVSAVNGVAALPIGQTFVLRTRRDGSIRNTTFHIID